MPQNRFQIKFFLLFAVIFAGGVFLFASIVNSDNIAPSDGDSSSATPTQAGSNVQFTLPTIYISDPSGTYYFAVCKDSSAPSESPGQPPTCNGLGTWCVSSSPVGVNLTASCDYTTSAGDNQSNDWYAWQCRSSDGFCISVPVNNNGDQGSPFVVSACSSCDGYVAPEPSDGGSSTNAQTAIGNNVVFTIAPDTVFLNGNASYYFAVCKTNSIIANGAATPDCEGGEWCISGSTAAASSATCSYPTVAGDAGANVWYAFECANPPSRCSLAAQGSGNNGSPFVVAEAESGPPVLRIKGGTLRIKNEPLRIK